MAGDREVAGYAVRVEAVGNGRARFMMAASATVPLRLHWATAREVNGTWRSAPSGWSTTPPRSEDGGGGAWVTDTESVDGAQYVEVEVDTDAETLAFLLRTASDRYVKRDDKDMYAPLRPEGERRAARSPSPPRRKEKRRERREERRHDEPATYVPPVSAPKKVGHVGRNQWNIDDLRVDDGALHGGGGYDEGLKDTIAGGEYDCQRSLMHRYNFAADQVGRAAGAGQDGLIVLLVWFRFMAMRQLVINRDYNIKPREISAAQEKVTLQLADIARDRRDLFEVTRLVMASIGRGGAGDVGQRIRDEILDVQRRNDCMGGMMEEWHQKLHNNTCPDDVVICEALLEYIESGLDIGAYWSRLEKDHVTKERLASYDRKICSEPNFKPSQCEGLTRDLGEYLRTLKAVHSGADLSSAAEVVLGYQRDACKGKAINVPPIGEVASDRLRDLLDVACDGAEAARKGGDPLPAIEAMVEARWELRPWTVGGRSVGDRTKDVIYLDLALESAVRTTIEGSLSRLGSRAPAEVMAITSAVLENVVMSSGDNGQLLLSLKEWQQVSEQAARGGGDWALRAKAAMDRVRNELGNRSERYMHALQRPAAEIGGSLGVHGHAVDVFAEEVVRGGAAAPLSQLLRVLDPLLRTMSDMGAWQVISPVEVTGRFVVVKTLADVQFHTYEEPTVLVAERVGGEEEIPDGAVAVLTPDMPDILSHVAVRARNEHRLFATVFDANVLDNLRAMDGQWVTCKPTGNGDDVVLEAAAEPAAAPAAAPAQPAGNPFGNPVADMVDAFAGQPPAADDMGSQMPSQISRKAFRGRYAVPSAEFSFDLAGSKSCNLNGLRGRMPDWINLPASVAIPFGVFDAVLVDGVNSEISRDIFTAFARLKHRSSSGKSVVEDLEAIRAAAGNLIAPPVLTEALHAAFLQEGLPWPGNPNDGGRGTAAWRAICGVWASKWNERAFISCKKANLNHADLSMAVLCQQVVDARYAFVIHTTNPTSGDPHELYAEVVCGLGEALVGNYPGRALSFTMRKDGSAPQVKGFPSKSVGLFVDGPTLIFRSDSNGEDLEGYAGAGLYDSIIMDQSSQREVDYSNDPLMTDDAFRMDVLNKIAHAGFAVEQVLGSAQDVEGAIDAHGNVYIVQTRPQV